MHVELTALAGSCNIARCTSLGSGDPQLAIATMPARRGNAKVYDMTPAQLREMEEIFQVSMHGKKRP